MPSVARHHAQGKLPCTDLEVIHAGAQVHGHAEGVQVGRGKGPLLRVPRLHDVHRDAAGSGEVCEVDLHRPHSRPGPGAAGGRRGAAILR